MTDLVEVIARAIYEIHAGRPAWDALAGHLKDDYRTEARAALAALAETEPTEAMLRAGLCSYFGSEKYARDHAYYDAQVVPRFAQLFRAMMKAAARPASAPEESA